MTSVPRPFDGKKSFQQLVVGKLDILMQKNETGLLLASYIKINSKCVSDLYVRAKTVKLLKETWGNIFMALDSVMTGLGNNTKGTSDKRKNRQIGLYENFKSFCIKKHYQQSKKTTHRMGGNILKSHMS